MAVFEVVIDEKRCKGCSLCVIACNQDCLGTSASFNESGYYYPGILEGKQGDCTGCGACVKLCPDFAVTVYEILEETG